MTRQPAHAWLAAVLLLAVLLAVPGAANAAPVLEYQLQYAPAANYSLLIVSAVADPQLPLPATVSVPVPTGATLLWSGEVLGGASGDDPSREVTVETVGGMDVYTMTLEQAYTAQLELQLPGAAVSGSRYSSAFTWTNPGEETPVSAAVVIPAGATDVEISPGIAGEPNANDAAETLYPLGGLRLAQGDSVQVEAAWSTGGAGTEDEAKRVVTLPVLLGLLVLAVVVLVIVVVRERTRARRAADRSTGV